MKILSQLRGLLPGVPIERDPEPCAATFFIASRIKRQNTGTPFPRQNDPQPGSDTRFAVECFREAAREAEHPAPPVPVPH